MRIKRDLLILIRSLKCCTVLGYWCCFKALEKKIGQVKPRKWKCVDNAWKRSLRGRSGVYIIFLSDSKSSVYIGSSEDVKTRVGLHLSCNSTGMFRLHNVVKECYDKGKSVWVLVLKIGRLSRTKTSLTEIEKKVYEACLRRYGDRLLNEKSPEVKKPVRAVRTVVRVGVGRSK